SAVGGGSRGCLSDAPGEMTAMGGTRPAQAHWLFKNPRGRLSCVCILEYEDGDYWVFDSPSGTYAARHTDRRTWPSLEDRYPAGRRQMAWGEGEVPGRGLRHRGASQRHGTDSILVAPGGSRSGGVLATQASSPASRGRRDPDRPIGVGMDADPQVTPRLLRPS